MLNLTINIFISKKILHENKNPLEKIQGVKTFITLILGR